MIFQYSNTENIVLMAIISFLAQIIRITPIIASIVCLNIYKDNSFICLAIKDAINCFLNQLIISIFIGFLLLITYFATIFISPNKAITVDSNIFFTAFNVAVVALNVLNIVYAIDSMIAIVFTLGGKRFKNPSIVRFVGSK